MLMLIHQYDSTCISVDSEVTVSDEVCSKLTEFNEEYDCPSTDSEYSPEKSKDSLFND